MDLDSPSEGPCPNGRCGVLRVTPSRLRRELWVALGVRTSGADLLPPVDDLCCEILSEPCCSQPALEGTSTLGVSRHSEVSPPTAWPCGATVRMVALDIPLAGCCLSSRELAWLGWPWPGLAGPALAWGSWASPLLSTSHIVFKAQFKTQK